MRSQGTLREAVEDFFEFATAECRPHPELSELEALLESRRHTIHQPMRVAFVGKTNAGKSTMMNAFLGQDLAPTGNGELTFNVSWFRYGERSQLLVHTIDGEVAEETFESLTQLSARCQDGGGLLERIRYIEVRCPNPLLKTFDLIDTPGLHSFYEKDSRNTRQLLNDPETRPHAVVFLFSGSLQEPDVRELENFHKSCGSLMSGLTAIGALTKVDELENPFEDGWRVIRQLQNQHPLIRRYFYTILPVVGPAAFGAQTLTTEEYDILRVLQTLPVERRRKITRDAATFCGREYPDDPSVPAAAERKRLFERLGRYGIRVALLRLDDGKSAADLPLELMGSSQVGQLRTVVRSHFGGRAYLIKVRSAFALIRQRAFQLSEQTSGAPAGSAARIAGRIDGILADELRMLEFSLLERFYRGTLPLDDNGVEQLLDITGEKGSSCAERLGQPKGTPVDQLLRIATQREQHWRTKAQDPFLKLELQSVARVLAESYGEITNRLEEAARHLRAAEVLLDYEL